MFSVISRIILVISLMAIGACGGGSKTPPVNQPPIANAGTDQEVNFSKDVRLSGVISSDPDGSITAYSWAQLSGTSINLSNANTATPSFISPRNDETLTFQLTVTDDDGATASNTVNIVVTNATPLANAGNDQVANFSELVNLIGTESVDSDGEVTTFSWTQISGNTVNLSDADTATSSFLAPSTDGILVFELTVTDNDGATSTSRTNVVINSPPIASAGSDLSKLETLETLLSAASSTDSDGTITSFEWTQLSGPIATIVNQDQSEATVTLPSTDTELTLVFQIEITDNNNALSSDTVEITVIPNFPPNVAIVFPKADSRFYGQVINVSGTVTREETESVPTILVGAGSTEIEAVVNEDGKWLAMNVPLPADNHNIVISTTATDQLGEVDTDANSLLNIPTLTSTFTTFDPLDPDKLFMLQASGVTRERLISVDLTTQKRELIFESSNSFTDFGQVFDVAFDPLRARILILDIGYASIASIDINTGVLTTLSGANNGNGILFNRPYNIAIDSVNDRLLVVDSVLNTLISVDLDSGNRIELSNNTGIGTGVVLDSPAVVDVNAAGNKAFVKSSSSGTIIEVDLDSGNRMISSSDEVGSGGPLGLVNSFVYDAAIDSLAALEWWWDRVVLVSSQNGDRSVLSDVAASGVKLGNPRQILLDSVNNQYIVDDISQNSRSGDLDALVGINRDTGERSIILEERVGNGPEVESYSGLEIDYETTTAYTANLATNSIFKINLVTGNRELLFDNSVDTAPRLDAIVDLALDKNNNRMIVLNSGNDTILAIDLTTGNRTILASSSIGTGPAITNPRAMTYRESNNTLFIADYELNAIIQLNLSNLERTILSDLNNGSGLNFITLTDIAFDLNNNRVLVTDSGNGPTISHVLFAVDLTSGDRTILSNSETGSGPNLHGPNSIKFDPINNVAIILDGLSRIMSVDLLTGNRNLISSDDIGNGETITNMTIIALDLDKNIIYGGGTIFEALWAIDGQTGDRIIVSK